MAIFDLRIWFLSLVLWSPMVYGCNRALSQDASARVQAMTARIAGEVNNNIACNADVIILQQTVVGLQQEINRLREKYEPKPEPVKP